MEGEKEKKPRTRSARPAKTRGTEDKSMADPIGESKTDSGKLEESGLPDEWISIAAYYIWKNDGEPEGRDAYYWERAKAELTQLRKEGNLPTGRGPLDEER